ncbi:RNA-binding S4 domain-containing protein [Paeniglutamicibacter sp. R2-26]|uniref:RNA-binding S4 domain-containing protein n=1 Tax=Paeniglutamicibacter sp. R2-26 TaxID=3144417 RepID=UPI003EE815A1
MASVKQESNAVRIDAWLWSIRVYKTRSAATAACRAGHVRLNDKPAKAAQIVVPGDTVRVRQSGFDRILEVTAVIAKRVGADIAARCYIDHTPVRPKEFIPQVPVRDRGAGRPTKKDRREMDRLRENFH